MKRAFARFLVVIVAVMAVFTSPGAIAQEEDDYEATIEALNEHIDELKGTVEARGKKINAQRTQIAELTGTEDEEASATGDESTIEVSGTNAVSKPFQLQQRSYVVKVDCTGVGFLMFLSLEDAPGSESVGFESLVSGEELPYSGSNLIEVDRIGEVVLVLEVIDGSVTCLVTFE